MTVNVDASRCIGCGMCAAAVPAVFQIQGRVSVVQAQPRTPAEEAGAFDAANGCPGQCHPGPEGMRKNRPPEHSSGRLFSFNPGSPGNLPGRRHRPAAVCPRPGHPASHR